MFFQFLFGASGDGVTQGDELQGELDWYSEVMCGGPIVRINKKQIGDRGARQVAAALRNPRCRVKTLNLQFNSIGDNGAKAIANAVMDNKTLQKLYLGFNEIGDDGAQAMADALRINMTLQWLDLGSNSISDTILSNICYILEFRESGRQTAIRAQQRKGEKQKQRRKDGHEQKHLRMSDLGEPTVDLVEHKVSRLTVTGSLILSQEELELVVRRVQQRIQDLDDDLSREALDEVESLQTKVTSLEKYRSKESILPSIVALEQQAKEFPVKRAKEILDSREQIKQLRDNGDFSAAKELAGNLPILQRQLDAAFEQSKERLRKAKTALETREIASLPSALTGNSVGSMQVQKCGSDLANALVASRQLPPVSVPLCYLADITGNWSSVSAKEPKDLFIEALTKPVTSCLLSSKSR